MTPLLFPVWWAANRSSASSTMSDKGRPEIKVIAVARPTIPPPMMAIS
jgi:hypothetical protein